MEEPERVGVEELQATPRYVEMVKSGRRVPVTENGKLVAYLVPAQEGGTTFERMVAAGQVQLATGNLMDLLPPPPAPPNARPLSEVLLEMRDEERY